MVIALTDADASPTLSAMVVGVSIDVDRSRRVDSGRIARKLAPMLALRTLTVKMTANFGGAASGVFQINSLERSLMIEWESMPSSPPLQRLASLVVKDGMTIGGLSAEDRLLALSLAWTALPVRPRSAREINERLREQLAGPGLCPGTDHGELLRWLVDGGWLQRDGFGREYRRVDAGAMPVEQQALARALAPLDTIAWVRAQRSELAERRAARRRAWQPGAGA